MDLDLETALLRGGVTKSRDTHAGTQEATPPIHYGNPYKRDQKHTRIHGFFTRLSEYLAPSGAKYCKKGGAASKMGEGWSANPFSDF